MTPAPCQPELLSHMKLYYEQLHALPRRMRRAMQRQWRLPLAGIALLLALGQRPALAATIPVGGLCTLAEAITAANTDTATGGCTAGRGADTIVLPAGSTQTLTEVNNDTHKPTGLPVISSVITIAGQGSTIAREGGAPLFRLLTVNNRGKLTLQKTTISGGDVFDWNLPEYGYRGGGIANYGGTLKITHSTISGNEGYMGGGVYNAAGGILTITNSTISGNYSRFLGGGVLNYGGTLKITHSTISGNNVYDGGGGGVSNADGGSAAITHSTISGNRALDGNGGGVNNNGTLTITHSTISGNTGFYSGGGVNHYGTLTITSSTISGNEALYDGGGVNNRGTLTITNSTISGNEATAYDSRGGGVSNGGTLTLARALVAGNAAVTSGPEIHTSGTVKANNYNLFGVSGTAGVAGFSPGPKDVVPNAGVQLSDILDPTLGQNGGPTQTHALVVESPAIDAGGPACRDATGKPLTTDQRGKPRPVDGDGDGQAACDIGAFEFCPTVKTRSPWSQTWARPLIQRLCREGKRAFLPS